MGARNQIPLSAYYLTSNLGLRPKIEVSYSRLAQLGDNAIMAGNLCKVIYPYADLTVHS